MTEVQPQNKNRSPEWGSTTKLIVGLTLVAVVGALFVQFKPIIGPLLLSFMLSFLLYPLVGKLTEKTKLSWKGSVNVIFLVLLILWSGSLTATGLAIVNQFQNLVGVVQEFVSDLPDIVRNLIEDGYVITIFNNEFDVSEYVTSLNIDLLAASEQILGVVQPLLGQAGGVLATVATSAFNTFVMGNFVLIITYFSLAEAKGGVNFLKDVELKGHKYDLGQMRKELSRIWNTYLSSQVFIFFVSFFAYLLLYSILGVRNTLALAFLAGLAKFVPYVGPIFTGVISALVAFFQTGGNPFGVEQLTYMIIVVAAAVLLDQLFDGFVAPRILGANLGIHPAAVLIAAIIAAQVIGFIGLIMAAPILATFQLFARYIILKMLDQDPWPDTEPELVKRGFSLRKIIKRTLEKMKQILSKIRVPWGKGKRK